MAKPNNKQKVQPGTGLYKRTRKRAKAQGEWKDVRKGGVTRGEAKKVKRDMPDSPAPQRRGNISGGLQNRTSERLAYLEQNGGLDNLEGIRKGGITRPEARQVKRAYTREQAFNPLAPRSGRDILRTGQAMTDAEYAPYESQLNQQGLNERGRQNVLYGPSGWMEGYRRDVAQAAQQQQAAELAFQAGANAVASQMAGAAQQPQLQPQGPGQPGVSPDMQAQAQQAALGRAGMQQEAATRLATRGASNVAQVNQMAIAAGQQAQEGLMESQARQQKIHTLAQELSREKGKALTGNIAKLTEQERTFDLANKTFGLDVAAQQEDVRSHLADEKQDRRELRNLIGQQRFDRLMQKKEFRLDVKKFGVDKAYKNWQKKHGNRQDDIAQQNADSTRMNANLGKDKADLNDDGKVNSKDVDLRDKLTKNAKGLSQSDRDKLAYAKTIARNLKKRGKLPRDKAKLIDTLVVGEKIPRRIARRAVQQFYRNSGNNNSGGGILDSVQDTIGNLVD